MTTLDFIKTLDCFTKYNDLDASYFSTLGKRIAEVIKDPKYTAMEKYVKDPEYYSISVFEGMDDSGVGKHERARYLKPIVETIIWSKESDDELLIAVKAVVENYNSEKLAKTKLKEEAEKVHEHKKKEKYDTYIVGSPINFKGRYGWINGTLLEKTDMNNILIEAKGSKWKAFMEYDEYEDIVYPYGSYA